MKNIYFERVDVLKNQPATFYLPLQVQPIVNGENGEPRDIEAADVEDLRVRISYVGETGRGKDVPFERLYNMVVVNVPASKREGDLAIIVTGKYGQVCLRAEIVCHIGKRGGVGQVLPPYISPVVGDCGTIAEIAPIPLHFTNNGDRSVGLGLTIYDDDESGWHPNLQVSYNGIDWADVEDEEFMSHDDQTYPFALTPHGSIYFRGTNPDGVNVDNDDFGINKFMSFEWSHGETEVSLSGDIMALVNYEKLVDVPQNDNKCFVCLFGQYDEGNACPITDASGLVPFFSVAEYSHADIFQKLKSLVNAPALPATTLANSCYIYMFSGCTSLVNAPVLPATTLADNCYNSMFSGCTALVNAPALPAKTLANSCYIYMFSGCTALVNAPVLPAKTLVSYCYSQMFHGCTSLRNIEMHAVALSPNNAVTNWVQGVPTGHDGTFVKNYDATWTTTGNSGVPTGWGITYKRA